MNRYSIEVYFDREEVVGMCKVGSVLGWQVIYLTIYFKDCGEGSSRGIFPFKERSINLHEQTFYS